jgi:glutathione S-transferase
MHIAVDTQVNGVQVDRFQGEIKTFNGPSNQPTDASNVIAKWFGYFQERLERNDDNDVKSDEFLYGKVSIIR